MDGPRSPYRFTARDLRKHAARYWKCPARLIESGQWAALWKGQSSRGSGAATSVLPVLALHTFPNPHQPEAKWTPRFRLTYRRLSALAGVNKSTIRPVFDRLVGLHYARLATRRIPHPNPEEESTRTQVSFRLSHDCYPAEGEAYTVLRASLFYSGLWASLPAAARNVWLVLRCQGHWWPASASELADLGAIAGLSRATLTKALAVLRKTPVRGQPLVEGLTVTPEPAGGWPLDLRRLVIPQGIYRGRTLGSLSLEEARWLANGYGVAAAGDRVSLLMGLAEVLLS